MIGLSNPNQFPGFGSGNNGHDFNRANEKP